VVFFPQKPRIVPATKIPDLLPAFRVSIMRQGVIGVYTKSLDKLPNCANELQAETNKAANVRKCFFITKNCMAW
jgi:hypothetical protein